MPKHWNRLLLIGLLAVPAWGQDAGSSQSAQPNAAQAEQQPDEIQQELTQTDQAQPVNEPPTADVDPATAQQSAAAQGEPQTAAPNQSDAEPSPADQMRQRILKQIEDLSRQPGDDAPRSKVHRQLVGLNDANYYRNQIEIEPKAQLESLNMLAQGLYVQMTRFTEPRLADRLRSKLRITARQAKAIELASAEAIGDFWLLTADLYEINHSELAAKARQQQAAELMADYLADYPDAETSPGVAEALEQLKGARLERLLQWTPQAVAQQADAKKRQAITDLIRRIHKRMPTRWWLEDIAVGRVTPTHWKTGWGTQVTLQRIGYRPLDMKRGKGGQVILWIMDQTYQGERRHGEAQTGPAGDLAEWRSHRVFIWGYTDGDWKAQDLIAEELKATDVEPESSSESSESSETSEADTAE